MRKIKTQYLRDRAAGITGADELDIQMFNDIADELDQLRSKVDRLTGTLVILGSHEPSWSDDFCRARAAVEGVKAVLKSTGRKEKE